MVETQSHFSELQGVVHGQEEAFATGFAIEVIPPLMPRSDGDNIFDEGKAFGGVVREGVAEACLTAAASPHTIPNIDRDRYLEAAADATGIQPRLPNSMDSVELFPPQTVIWWRRTGSRAPTDLVGIADLPEQEKDDFLTAITAQAKSGIEMISGVADKPTIWGSWGFGGKDERVTTGRGRGVPTNPHGHLHVVDFSKSMDIPIGSEPVSPEDRINHYGPWSILFHEQFREPVGQSIQSTISEASNRPVSVEPFTEVKTDQATGSPKIVNNGYRVEYPDPVLLSDVLRHMSEMTKEFESLFQSASDFYTRHHKYSHSDSSESDEAQRFVQVANGMGFATHTIDELAKFIQGIRPTYTQISQWAEELIIEGGEPQNLRSLLEAKDRYKRVSSWIAARAHSNIYSALISGVFVDPDEDHPNPPGALSVHSSGAYVIDDYELVNNDVAVRSFTIHPSLDATYAAPERVTGRILRRATGH